MVMNSEQLPNDLASAMALPAKNDSTHMTWSGQGSWLSIVLSMFCSASTFQRRKNFGGGSGENILDS